MFQHCNGSVSGRVQALRYSRPLWQLYESISICPYFQMASSMPVRRLTSNRLPILLLLPIKDGVFVLRNHLLLSGHLVLPPIQSFRRQALLSQSFLHAIDDAVHRAQTLALSCFLQTREPPWDLPTQRTPSSAQRQGRANQSDPGGATYHKRPPDRGLVALKAPNPNMIDDAVVVSCALRQTFAENISGARKPSDQSAIARPNSFVKSIKGANAM